MKGHPKASRDTTLLPSPNSPLQRSGTHKVLSPGRAITSWAGAARPRSVPGRRAATERER